MEPPQQLNLFVTFVEKEGPFLKVWGQTDKTTSLYVERILLGATPQFERGIGLPNTDTLKNGTLVCAKYKDDKYYRARILNTDLVEDGTVEVSFLDYGNRDFVPCSSIRNLEAFAPSFISIPPLVTGFIFAEAHCPGGGEWNEGIFETISSELRYQELQFTVLTQATQYYIVKFYIDNNDLGTIFINRGMMQPISLQAQEAVLLSMSMNKLKAQQAVQPTAEINTFKACHLEPGMQYEVYVSYVDDGPCHFSVQLKQSEKVLVKLMKDINNMNLKPLEDFPLPGTICLAICQEDKSICRAVVTNEIDNHFKVFFVDFGNYEIVPLEALFQIPFKFVIPKVMAIRFSLSGVEKSTMTIDMQCAFKKFVDNRLLHMRVLPSPTRLAIPKCELWDPESKTSALDVINRAALNAYPEPISLSKGFSQQIKVSFVYSCNRFYVQLMSKEPELNKLMLDLQNICAANDIMDPSMVRPNLPCCALYESDNQWYRSQIVQVNSDSTVKVRYIDYGNEEIVTLDKLKSVHGELLTVLRPQAIECCLNGYQNMEPEAERDKLLEELILEECFTMKVIEMLGTKALVDMIDGAKYNVASLLLDRLAASKSQVSPHLVQDGNRIEHRKSYQNGPREQHFKPQDRRQIRDRDKQWNNDNPNETSWRTEYKSNRNDDRASNEYSSEQTWRQNKGFNRNNRYDNGNRNSEEHQGREEWPDASTNSNKSSSPSQNEYGRNRRDNFRDNNRNQKRYDHNENSNWNNKPRNDFKRRDFKKEGSEVSSSGSEKSFQKNFRTRNEPSKFQNGNRNRPYKPAQVNEAQPVLDPAPANSKFEQYSVQGTSSSVAISWFHSPVFFFCQLLDTQADFKQLMDDIHEAYKGKKTEVPIVGSPVIALFPEDKVLYRAQVLEVVNGRCKVFFVDFGNVCMVDKVYPIEKKFMAMPAQAIACGLAEVEPVGAWGEADVYARYFDKQEYVCTFLNKVEDRWSVQLCHQGNDIGTQLVDDGLAKIDKINIEVPILLGQQFRATVRSVNSLDDFIIVLRSVALKCKMHNLEKAIEKHDDIIKSYLGTNIIVYVDNVIDNRLEVTLYDINGHKLKIISPDEGAYDEVDYFCPLLITASNMKGTVAHAEEGFIFFQPDDQIDPLTKLLTDLFDYYEQQQLAVPLVPIEGGFYAALSADANWYRAKVLNVDNEAANVQYIDYGNSEKIPIANLRELSDEFIQLNMCSIKLKVDCVSTNYIDKEITVDIVYGSDGWECKIKSLEGETPEAETEAKIESDQDQTETELKGALVQVSHIDSPTDFYLQQLESLNSIKSLQEELQALVVDMPVLENPSPGVLCAAPYSADQDWYRAEVLDADDDITTVRFIDFGNTDVIDNKVISVKTLPQHLLSLAVYAVRCSLKLKPIEEDWTAAALDRFEALTQSNVSVQFVDRDEKINFVELYSNGKSVKDILINENLAKAHEVIIDNKSTCFISHINSPSEFWIQFESFAEELERIAEQLSGAEGFPELEDLTPGTLCVASYPDDLMWYRARILSNTVAGTELLYIDYGNSGINSHHQGLRQIPEDLVVTPPLAQKCSLQKPEGLLYWSPQAVEKFNELAADGETIFTVRKVTTDETSVVELFVNGENAIEKLLPVTEKATVKNFESLDCFKLEKNGDVLEGKFKLEVLPGMAWSSDSDNLFKNVDKTGNTVFDVEFVKEDLVRLYLEGRDIRDQLGAVKASLNNSFEEASKVSDSERDNTNPESLGETSDYQSEPNQEGSIEEKALDDVIDQKAGGDNLLSDSSPGSNQTDKGEEKTSRPSSSCKISHDDRILPGLISNPPEVDEVDDDKIQKEDDVIVID